MRSKNMANLGQVLVTGATGFIGFGQGIPAVLDDYIPFRTSRGRLNRLTG
jgi:hypothetical protein